MPERGFPVLPLLEYSAKKEQILRDYFEALSRELYSGEPWHDAHQWAILTGQLDELFQDTLQLYISTLRADELHHYTAFTSPGYAYADIEGRLQNLFYVLHQILVNELEIAAKLETQGYFTKKREALEKCLKDVNTILAGESSVYNTAQFYAMLQQSLDDINSGRVEEMFPEP
jgi:hypothetical protein